jgi:hypothetical protein
LARVHVLSGRTVDKAAGIWVCKPPWHKVGPLNQLALNGDPDQLVGNKNVSLSFQKDWFQPGTGITCGSRRCRGYWNTRSITP